MAKGGPLDVVEQMPDPVPQMLEAANELARVPEGARFATERDFPSEIEHTKVSHPDFWLAWASGRNTLNNRGVVGMALPLAGPTGGAAEDRRSCTGGEMGWLAGGPEAVEDAPHGV
ncbi:MAG TPA: hypothetical protein VM287_09900 [Egibacteraceae bacterium]|nr:hypothetical protein [Egibacteraceae bacterium]